MNHVSQLWISRIKLVLPHRWCFRSFRESIWAEYIFIKLLTLITWLGSFMGILLIPFYRRLWSCVWGCIRVFEWWIWSFHWSLFNSRHWSPLGWELSFWRNECCLRKLIFLSVLAFIVHYLPILDWNLLFEQNLRWKYFRAPALIEAATSIWHPIWWGWEVMDWFVTA